MTRSKLLAKSKSDLRQMWIEIVNGEDVPNSKNEFITDLLAHKEDANSFTALITKPDATNVEATKDQFTTCVCIRDAMVKNYPQTGMRYKGNAGDIIQVMTIHVPPMVLEGRIKVVG